jgi:bifunctional non-homologous end joining protein LigD
VRALEGAPVATPLELSEIDDARLAPRKWRIDNLLRRLGQKGDPWSDFRRRATRIETAARALDRIGRR